MAAPIRLRVDYDGVTLHRLAKASEDANQTRRLLALAVITRRSSTLGTPRTLLEQDDVRLNQSDI